MSVTVVVITSSVFHPKDLLRESLARHSAITVKSVGLDVSNCRGLRFGGASAMMKFRGYAYLGGARISAGEDDPLL